MQRAPTPAAPAAAPLRAPAVTKLPQPVPRNTLRMGLPSKGRMAEDTLQLLKARGQPGRAGSCAGSAPPPLVLSGSRPLHTCPASPTLNPLEDAPLRTHTHTRAQDSALSVYKPNPRQYVASIPQIPGLEVWFQRASDVVRKLRLGDIDLGIVGYDMFQVGGVGGWGWMARLGGGGGGGFYPTQ